MRMDASAKRLARNLRSQEPAVEGFYWNLYRTDSGLVAVYSDLCDARFDQLMDCHRRALTVPGVVHALPERISDGAVIRWEGDLPRSDSWRFSHLVQVVEAIRGLHAAGVVLNDGALTVLDPSGQAVIYNLGAAWVPTGQYPADGRTYRDDFRYALNGWLTSEGYPAAELVTAARLGAAQQQLARGVDVPLGWLWRPSDWSGVAARCAERAAAYYHDPDQAVAHYGQAVAWAELTAEGPDPLAAGF